MLSFVYFYVECFEIDKSAVTFVNYLYCLQMLHIRSKTHTCVQHKIKTNLHTIQLTYNSMNLYGSFELVSIYFVVLRCVFLLLLLFLLTFVDSFVNNALKISLNTYINNNCLLATCTNVCSVCRVCV